MQRFVSEICASSNAYRITRQLVIRHTLSQDTTDNRACWDRVDGRLEFSITVHCGCCRMRKEKDTRGDLKFCLFSLLCELYQWVHSSDQPQNTRTMIYNKIQINLKPFVQIPKQDNELGHLRIRFLFPDLKVVERNILIHVQLFSYKKQHVSALATVLCIKNVLLKFLNEQFLQVYIQAFRIITLTGLNYKMAAGDAGHIHGRQ